MRQRDFGVLCSITSLPSRHGIGDFGPASYKFVDDLKKAKAKLWQILPLNPIGYGHSPYQPYSSYAIDEQFISLDFLVKEGLLKEAPVFLEDASKVQYEAIREYKLNLLREAFSIFTKVNTRPLEIFAKKHPWVRDWSVFSMYHRRYARCWNEWPEEAKNWILNRPELSKEDLEAANFEIFLQLIAYKQWEKLHRYAHLKGIEIIGDIPFYVGFDSCDVWANQQVFLLNEETREPDWIAGVPPDYFSATGQRWGNPIYDWDYLEKTDFAFVHERILINAELYDIIRLDHFRAFDTYWKIIASCPTAVDGSWIEAPGYALFDSLFKKAPKLKKKIIAEDLGDLRPEVLILRDHYDFPGMNVVEFTFDDAELAKRDGFDKANSVVYLGTHDNDTIASFLQEMNPERREAWMDVLKEKGFDDKPVDALIAYCLRKKAKHVILSVQDLLGLGGEARTNVPSTVDERNWTFRLPTLSSFEDRIPYIAKAVKETERI